MRRKGRVDDCQVEGVKYLRRCGCVDQDLSGVGSGVPDYLFSFGGRWFMVEWIGTEKFKKYRPTGGLSDDQVRWHARHEAKVIVAKSGEEAWRQIQELIQ